MSMLPDPSQKYRPCPAVELRDRRWPDAVLDRPPIWASVDLRDGNQALIEPMNADRKLRLFEMLVRIGFKEIEVGFPSASQTEFDFIRLLIEEKLIPDDVTIQVLTPARGELIRRTFEALRGVPRAIVHLYNATAPVMRRTVFGMNEEQVIGMAVEHARLIRELAAQAPETDWTFQYSPEMFSSTELAFGRRIVDAVTEVWAPTPQRKCIVNLPTTVENSTPNVFADRVEWMHRRMARRDSIVLSVHPHNDRGTGTATAELALMAGADRVEGCLFGNGERTGNLDLVNVALNLYTQGVHPGLDFSDIDEIRRCVEYCNQLPVHPRHPYAGDLVYTSFSGSHQDAIRKAFAARGDKSVWDIPYLPVDPKDLGRSYEAVIRVNSQSGKGGISYLLEEEYGLQLPRRLQIEFSQVVQAATDASGKEWRAGDIWALFQREYLGEGQGEAGYAYLSHQLGPEAEGGVVSLEAQLRVGDQTRAVSGRGNGPIAAFVDALAKAADLPVQFMDYHEHALSTGATAAAAAFVEMQVGEGPVLFGVGIDADIVAASFKAIVSGMNRAARRQAAARAQTEQAHG
jgi:2-isopropylmalate synthase